MKIKNLYAILILLTLTFNAFGQTEYPEKFEYLEKGINDFVVTKVEGKSTQDIYSKSINWIKETYKNPDKVLTMKIDNEKIRINAIANGLLSVRKFSFNMDYTIEISIRDGRYKFELVSLETSDSNTDYKQIPNFKTDKKLIKNFGNSPNNIENYFNVLNNSLKNYIIEKDKKNDW
jgi:hypothetical protein